MSDTILMQCTWQVDSPNPSDGIMINPVFKAVSLGGGNADYQGLASDLAAALDAWTGYGTQLTVKAYDALAAKPNLPKATVIHHQGTFLTTSVNRDVAVCLSFYSTPNQPRRRGRLYVPVCIMPFAVTGAFVSAANMTKVAGLVPVLTGLGGVNVDWVVWSRANANTNPVTNWYVDNSWDTQRRRGPLPTTRQQGTTTEGDIPNLVSLIPGGGMVAGYDDAQQGS